MSDKKVAKATKDSTAIIADGDVYVGLTYEDAKNVALDTFRANFYELAGVAQTIVDERVEYITDKILEGLKKEHPDGLDQAQDPGFMSALYEAQMGYVKSGDEDLEKVLINLLVDRSKETSRNLKQLVLNEAIKTAERITAEQADILSLIFIITKTRNNRISSHQEFSDYFSQQVLPLLVAPPNDTNLFHLSSTGCGDVLLGGFSLEGSFVTHYDGLFTKGFELTEEISNKLSRNTIDTLIRPCLNDNSKWQVNIVSKDKLDNYEPFLSIPPEEQEQIRELCSLGIMDHNEIRDKTIELLPAMKDLYEIWENTKLKLIRLTGVGIAIGHSNLIRKTGLAIDLNIWINDDVN